MKISILIKKLQDLHNKHGDIETTVDVIDNSCCYNGDEYHECYRNSGQSKIFSLEEVPKVKDKTKPITNDNIEIISINICGY